MTQSTTWKQAIAAELARLDSPIKISTVTAYIQRKVHGLPYDTADFWEQEDTCARSTWNKWKKHDPVFMDVREKCWEIATGYRNETAAAAIADAVQTLQLAAPAIASRIVEIATERSSYHADKAVTLRAALGALDRAHTLTASKGTPVTIVGLDDAIEKIYGREDDGGEDGGEDTAAGEDADADPD